MLTVDAGLTPGSTLQPLYFRSKAFIDLVRSDIHTLTTSFSDQHHPRGDFSTFKALWIQLDWPHVHLSMLEPGLKRVWWDTVTRCWIDQLLLGAKAAAPSRAHLCAFYALYLLYYTQPHHHQEQYKIRLAPSTIQFLLRLPEVTTQQQEKQDVVYTLTRFLGEAIYVIPETLKADPLLPTNRTSGQLASDTSRELGKLSHAIQCEAASLAVWPPSQQQRWATGYVYAQEGYIEARDEVRGHTELEGLLEAGQRRLVSAYPGAFDQQHQQLVGQFGSQAGELQQRLKGLPFAFMS